MPPLATSLRHTVELAEIARRQRLIFALVRPDRALRRLLMILTIVVAHQQPAQIVAGRLRQSQRRRAGRQVKRIAYASVARDDIDQIRFARGRQWRRCDDAESVVQFVRSDTRRRTATRCLTTPIHDDKAVTSNNVVDEDGKSLVALDVHRRDRGLEQTDGARVRDRRPRHGRWTMNAR